MKVSVTSRWGLTSSASFQVEKADYPAPTIRTGSWSTPSIRFAMDKIRIETEIRQSECAVGDQILDCSWSCESHKPDYNQAVQSETQACENNLFASNKLVFPTSGGTLVIPRYTLTPPEITAEERISLGEQIKMHEYSFQILCKVQGTVTGVSAAQAGGAAQSASESVVIRIRQAPLAVFLFPAGTQFPQKATTMALNARFTLDPDIEETFACSMDPGSSSCNNLPAFEGSFTFKCWKTSPLQTRRRL